MKRSIGILAVGLWAAPSFGEGINGYEGAKLGWTADSRYFVYQGQDTQACDVQSGQCDPVDDAWTAAHPTTPASPSRTSEDGKAEASVTVHAPGGGGSWSGNVWTPSAQATVDLDVVREGKTTSSAVWSGTIHSLDVYWSPDRKRVAWLIRPSSWMGMDSSFEVAIELGSAGLPRIQLLADKSILKTALPQARKALDAAGFLITGSGLALKARPASVVYFAVGQDALAKTVAAAVPGGATIEKLSWKASAEVVVALGSSVLKGGKP